MVAAQGLGRHPLKIHSIIVSRKKKPLPVIENFEITGVAAEGKSLGRWNDLVTFVPYGARAILPTCR